MLGMYMNTMKYQFSDPLSIIVHVGYLYQPFGSQIGSQKTDGLVRNNNFLSGFELTYQPKNNFFLRIEYGAIPYQNSDYARYRIRSGW
jgi:DNA primase catalytic subunit